MITVIQRVKSSSVSVNDLEIGRIGPGIMALVAIQKEDTENDARRLLQRILSYRIFPDENDRMNLSLQNIQGGLLLIPQFTLAADTQKGNRPSFSSAAPPEQGELLFNYFTHIAKQQYPLIEQGRFGADMQVSLINDGPVTFTLTT